MKKHYTIYFLFLTLFAKAQSTKVFQLNFETNSYEISKENKSLLDNEIIALKKLFYKSCKIEITGYTDNTGAIKLNEILSNNRAKSITNYFVQKGFAPKNITSKGKSYKNPIADNATEDGKSKNRRVSVKIALNFNDVLSINKFKEKSTVYNFDNQLEKHLTYKSGTKVIIPENSFIDENGKDVQGEITIKYQEFRKPIDFILAGITMDIDDNGKNSFFNSGGMFKITALKNGKEIFLKKDKNIQVDFNLVGTISNLNFYGLDTISNKWKELAKITNTNGLRYNGMLGCGYYPEEEEPKCSLNICQSLHYINTVGVEYANREISLFNQANYTDPSSFEKIQQTIQKNKEKIVSNNNRIKIISNKLKNNKINYHLNKLEQKENKIVFEITELNNQKSQNETFSKAKWKCLNKNLNTTIFSKNWTVCLIEKSNSDSYLITLKDSVSKNYITNVSIETKKRIRKKKKATYISDLLIDLNKNSIEVNKNDSICKNLITQKNNLEKNTKILSNYKKGNDNSIINDKIKDSIACFVQYSRTIMSKNELNMDQNTWLTYFDSHRELMLNRYTNLTQNDDFKKCIEMEIEAEKGRLKFMELQRQAQLNDDKTLDLVQSFKINNLGIYNCDQIQRLQNPIEILAEYKDEKGKIINPNFIYLIDSEVNGIIRYDSNRTDYNPSRFAYNPSSKNSLLIFDEDGESYLFSSKKFIKLENKITNKQLFIIEKIKNRAEIENEF